MNKFFFLSTIFFFVISLALDAQDSSLTKKAQLVFSGIMIKKNDFYDRDKKVTRIDLINKVNATQSLEGSDKKQLVNDLEKFYKYRSNKRSFFPIAAGTFALGSGFTFLNFLRTDETNSTGKYNSMILMTVFGGASVALVTGGIINAVKFKRKKREFLKYCANE